MNVTTKRSPMTSLVRAMALIAALLFGLAAGTLWLELAAPDLSSGTEAEAATDLTLDTAEAEAATPALP